jgi:hypothetical protein
VLIYLCHSRLRHLDAHKTSPVQPIAP